MRHDRFIKTVLPLKDKLFRLALRITGNREDAEDVVQDAMLNVWHKQDIEENIDNLEAYCMRSTRNIALDKIVLKDNQHNELKEEIELPENIFSIEDEFERKEEINWLHVFIEKLPEKQKTIIQLRDIEGLSYKEIATILDLSEEQIKITLFRARQKIKVYFGKINDL